jgi:hypothetical protein
MYAHVALSMYAHMWLLPLYLSIPLHIPQDAPPLSVFYCRPVCFLIKKQFFALSRFAFVLFFSFLAGGCVGPGLSLAWTAWLRLRCNTLPMKEVRSPRPISVSGAAFPSVSTPCVCFHRCSLGFAGVISRKRHDLRPGRTCVTQNQLCRRCRALVEPA